MLPAMSPAPDTIFALSSGRPPAAIAVVRISGPRARFALETIAGRVPEPRRAMLARLRSPENGEIIDEGLVLWFPAPSSETGEDVVELQIHGGHAVVAALLGALGRIEGLRPAEAGEFARRAFENGKLDLTAAEGLADLIGAETEAQRRQAYRQLKGLIGDRAEAWRARLIEALALVEAGIDFPDEGDVPEDLMAPALAIVRGLADEISAALAQAGRGERLREGLTVAIAGPPNAGKSTLLNRIVRREAAIVSPFAGTTRDVIEVHLDLDGYPVTLLDTAGIHESDDPVEQEGVRRARGRAAGADLVLWIVDPNEPMEWGDKSGENLFNVDIWLIQNKVDLAVNRADIRNEYRYASENKFIKGVKFIFSISAKTGLGMDGLLSELRRFANAYFAEGEAGIISRIRHRYALEMTYETLRRVLAEGPSGRDDIVAEELRSATTTLGRLTGRVDVEDILNAIFRDFCIGK
jgi:tRNA modification GTPase